jgi:hypothetical protein
LGTYAPYAAQGISLYSQGAITSDTLFAGLLDPGAIGMAALTGGIPTAVNEMLGMRTSNWGTMGQSAFSVLGGAFAGPLGGIIGGLIGGTAGMALGDAFNARQNEVYRDILEDSLGFFGGVDAYASGGFDYSVFGDEADQYGGYPSGGDYSGGMDNTGGGFERSSEPGGMGGYAGGGLVDRLMVPRGEDGWAPLQLNEGVVSRRGMATLESINSGNFSGSDLSELIAVVRMLIWDLRQKNHPIVRAVEKTAKYTEISVRRQVAA